MIVELCEPCVSALKTPVPRALITLYLFVELKDEACNILSELWFWAVA